MTNNKIEQLKDLAEALIKSLDYYRINEDWICDQGHDLSLDSDYQNAAKLMGAKINSIKTDNKIGVKFQFSSIKKMLN